MNNNAKLKLIDGFIKYVQCQFQDGATITVGHLKKGDYSIHIENNLNGKETTANIILPEKSMTGILTSLLIYAETYGIDLNEKIREIINGDNILYSCKEE